MKISIEVTDYFEEHIQVRSEVIHCDMLKSEINTYRKSDFESIYSKLMEITLKTFEIEFKKTIVSEE